MNVNEVIANLGNQLLEQKGKEERLHPNDDVNMSQSSNDTFPTALHVAGVLAVEDQLLPAIAVLKATFADKSDTFKDIIKIGRTHLQDATPITLGQEISGWEAMLGKSERMIRESVQYLKELAIGGTAVGTGINAHPTLETLLPRRLASIQVKILYLHQTNSMHLRVMMRLCMRTVRLKRLQLI